MLSLHASTIVTSKTYESVSGSTAFSLYTSIITLKVVSGLKGSIAVLPEISMMVFPASKLKAKFYSLNDSTHEWLASGVTELNTTHILELSS